MASWRQQPTITTTTRPYAVAAMKLNINPPLINSACPWATTLDDLRALYHNPHTGGVTTRTHTLTGFPHDDAVHQYAFFDINKGAAAPLKRPDSDLASDGAAPETDPAATTSANTLGYSPIPLATTLEHIHTLAKENPPRTDKPIIVSVTGSPGELIECYRLVSAAARAVPIPLLLEVNLSCPNIAGRAPPAYDTRALREYLLVLRNAAAEEEEHGEVTVPMGLKVPPYTNPVQFSELQRALLGVPYPSPVAFVTATNTLWPGLLLNEGGRPALYSETGEGVGGMGGVGLHTVALGNVRMLRRTLDLVPTLAGIRIIGVGGVKDRAGFERMKAAGADVVGVATALGRRGVGVFGEILDGGRGSRL
ncbi:FMN-linked oxidoreductase [Trichodelitschia bisporula]|uniref:FMN-linked oxidoreductase n=1 Tax=Trichodelitschia bisporula TaxID=703511 RepID=A0A6G1HYV1_9PEZI|nr:FMN-linked oxidoreductase [Trichodelitschia bisporula]